MSWDIRHLKQQDRTWCEFANMHSRKNGHGVNLWTSVRRNSKTIISWSKITEFEHGGTLPNRIKPNSLCAFNNNFSRRVNEMELCNTVVLEPNRVVLVPARAVVAPTAIVVVPTNITLVPTIIVLEPRAAVLVWCPQWHYHEYKTTMSLQDKQKTKKS